MERVEDEDGIAVVCPVWEAWRPGEVAARLAGVRARWYVAGGWAIDLFLGERTRPHDDLEIAVAATDFPAVRAALAGHEFDVVGDGRRWPLDAAAFQRHHQTWVRDAAGVYRLDVFREPHDGDVWICRRDETLRRPYAEIVRRTPDGIPYLVPEIVLLFKAKAARPKDRADLAAALPALGPVRRAWLRRWLARVHPGHEWLPLL
jgi:hypothetical protein